MPSKEQLETVFNQFLNKKRSNLARECIIELANLGATQANNTLINDIVELMIEHNQQMEIFQLGSNLFKALNKNKNYVISNKINANQDSDAKIFILHSAQCTGENITLPPEYLNGEHSIITTERIIEIQLANKQELGFHLLKQCSLCQNAARLQKLTKHCVVQDADFVQENFDDLQLMSSYLNAAQLKQMLFWAHSEYTGQFNQLGKCFLEKSDPQNQLEVLEFCVQHAHEHVSLKAGLQSGCAGFAQLTGHLSHALNRPVLFSEIDSRLPSEPISSTRVRELVNERPQLMFINLAFISAICSFQPDFDFDLFFQYFLVGAGVCSFVTQRPDDFMISQSEQQYQQVGELNEFMRNYVNKTNDHRPQYNDINKLLYFEICPQPEHCVLDESKLNIQFFIGQVLQFLRVFALIIQGNSQKGLFSPTVRFEVKQDQCEQIAAFLTTISLMPTQEFFLKTLKTVLSQCKHFQQMITKQIKLETLFSLRRRSQNIRNVFEIIVQDDYELQKSLHNEYVELLTNADTNLNKKQTQLINIIEVTPQCLSIENLLLLLRFLDCTDWNVKNSLNGILQRYSLFAEKAEISVSDILLENIVTLSLGESGCLVRLIILKKCDYSENSDQIRKLVLEFSQQQRIIWENKSKQQNGIDGYKYEQYRIIAQQVIDRLW
ncbi:Conserved_hypothetical protein [Hexamita inflata]|uniref:Uncharacterized protein n=1 Tax=Hexamita inflata TaxID=28002 RepID=A0AA86UJR6_9EUKA|nr:Conserved hypothetical protein [Hexamita inflata]